MPRGHVAYEPDSVGGGCSLQAGAAGFVTFAQPVDDGQGIAVPAAMPKALGARIEVMDFISNQVRHGKTLLALGASKALVERSGASATLANGDADPGMVVGAAAKADRAVADFITALGRHRHPEREGGAAPGP